MQRLTAAAGTEIHDTLTGSRLEQQRDELAALVLDLEAAVAKRLSLKQRLALACGATPCGA